MKRILIHEDKALFENFKKDLQAFKPVMVKLQKTYESLEIGTFTNEVLKTLKNKGTNPIEVDFYEYIGSQLGASGITSTTIRQNMIKGSEPLFLEFKNSFQEAKNFTPRQYGLNLRPALDFNLISFEDKTRIFTISKVSQEQILETFCRIYLEDEKEKSLHNALQDFVKAQDQVKKVLNSFGYKFNREGYEIHEIMNVFLNSLPEVHVKPSSIRHAVNQRQQRERDSNRAQRFKSINI